MAPCTLFGNNWIQDTKIYDPCSRSQEDRKRGSTTRFPFTEAYWQIKLPNMMVVDPDGPDGPGADRVNSTTIGTQFIDQLSKSPPVDFMIL